MYMGAGAEGVFWVGFSTITYHNNEPVHEISNNLTF